ncbi:MAG: DsrE/DsrF/DrsH-like family protein [Planctomycetes bacterium]|nr:DsrE/DsrF/DrsH-like family protein [Planctomycetota bacterium]
MNPEVLGTCSSGCSSVVREDARKTHALTAVVFSGELDRVMAALNIATATAATGAKVALFFTFWGTSALIDPNRSVRGKSLVERCFGRLLPRGARSLKLSRLHLAGIGRSLLLREMRRKGVADLEALLSAAGDLGVEIVVCEMSMSIMGIAPAELVDYPGLRVAGACSYAELAARSESTLFI